MSQSPIPGRSDFAQRIRLQIQSRYRDQEVRLDDERFAVRLVAPGIDLVLPLTPLYHSCERSPANTATLIASFVRSIEQRLIPSSPPVVSAPALVWCVRSRSYLSSLSRSDELVTQEVGADLVAFIAEMLPSTQMRGVDLQRLQASGLDEAAARSVADSTTRQRFEALATRIQNLDRIPADGWRAAGDILFAGSALLAPAVLAALHHRAGGDVLLAVPDRSVLLALPAHLPSAERFHLRVMREWREAMNPCSSAVLRTDGVKVVEEARSGRRAGRGAGQLLGWLRD